MVKKKNTPPEDWLKSLEPRTFAHHHYAAAQAVLAPLCGLKCVRFPVRIETVKATHVVWQRRIRELASYGLGHAEKPIDLGHMVHCPSLVFASNFKRNRPCKRERICPFCCGLDAALRHENIVRALQRVYSPVGILRGCVHHHCSLKAVPAYLDQLHQHLKDVRELNPAGLITRTTVSADKHRRGPVLVRIAWIGAHKLITHRYRYDPEFKPVTLYPDLGWFGEQSKVLFESAGSGEPSPAQLRKLAQAVSYLHRYPTGLLYSDPKLTVYLYDNFNLDRLNTTTGIFRHSNSAVILEQIHNPPIARPSPAHSDDVYLCEEERLYGSLPTADFDHNGFIARALVERLGLKRKSKTVENLCGIRPLIHWVGALDLGTRSIGSLIFNPPPALRALYEGQERASIIHSPAYGYRVVVPDTASRRPATFGSMMSLGSFVRFLKNSESQLPDPENRAKPA